MPTKQPNVEYPTEGITVNGWNLDMSKAPRNEPIIVYCDHSKAPEPDESGKISIYQAWCEGLGYRTQPHQCIAVYGGGYADGPEDGGGSMADWWFDANSDFEIPVYPVAWREGFTDPDFAAPPLRPYYWVEPVGYLDKFVEQSDRISFAMSYFFTQPDFIIFDGSVEVEARGKETSIDYEPYHRMLNKLRKIIYAPYYANNPAILAVGSGNSFKFIRECFAQMGFDTALPDTSGIDKYGKFGELLGMPMYTDEGSEIKILSDTIQVRFKHPFMKED